jgi:hypothetical protein
MNSNGYATAVFHDKKISGLKKNDHLKQKVIFIIAYWKNMNKRKKLIQHTLRICIDFIQAR